MANYGNFKDSSSSVPSITTNKSAAAEIYWRLAALEAQPTSLETDTWEIFQELRDDVETRLGETVYQLLD